MEIKILVQLNERAELKKFVETCEEHGMELTREGGGKLPSFSGYYAELKGVRWQKADTGKRQLTIPDVVGQSEQLKAFADYAQKRMWEDGDKDLSEFVDEFLRL